MKVYLLAATRLADGFVDFLNDLGHTEWFDSDNSDGDLLAETAGRLCYKSWAAGVNANVTKITLGNDKYLANILSSRHGSVLEHVNFTFLLKDVSRVLTHELVRHRVGVAYSQESLRYCRLEELEIVPPVFPEGISHNMADHVIEETVDTIRAAVAELNRLLLTDAVDFDTKKKLTSLIRRVAPIGVKTNIIFTANTRALRHIIEQRTNVAAEVEIRSVFSEVAELCQKEAPNCFQDMYLAGDGSYRFENSKV